MGSTEMGAVLLPRRQYPSRWRPVPRRKLKPSLGNPPPGKEPTQPRRREPAVRKSFPRAMPERFSPRHDSVAQRSAGISLCRRDRSAVCLQGYLHVAAGRVGVGAHFVRRGDDRNGALGIAHARK